MLQLLIILLCFITASCHKQPSSVFKIEQTMMQMPLCIQLKGPLSPQQQLDVETAICNTFSHIDRVYNIFNPLSEVSRFNQTPAWTPVMLSDELASFLKVIESFVIVSNGRFDPTIHPLQAIWMQHLKQHKIPSIEDLSILQHACGWHTICLTHRIAFKRHDLTALDLCAAAKGLAVDKLVCQLQQLGFDDIYVEWGGEISTRGMHPSHRPWKIAILGTNTIIEGACLSVATSGHYYQNWQVDQTVYSHVFDPLTQRPLEIADQSIVSATVVAQSCMLADMLATTLLLFSSKQQAMDWQAAHFPDAQVWLFTQQDWQNSLMTHQQRST